MTASDYLVSFPYGATTYPYSYSHPHRGNDYPCPYGTQLVISGTLIGLTGNTGYILPAPTPQYPYSGSHLHVQEWRGDIGNTRKPQNAFKAGQVIAVGVSSDFGNYITIQTPDGWNDSYCHLSQVYATNGQVIGDEEMITQAFEYELAKMATGSYPGVNYSSKFVGTSNWDGMMAFWQKQTNKSNQEFENTLAMMQTGFKPGANYNYQYDGVPIGGAKLIVDFWSKQASGNSAQNILNQIKQLVS